MPLSAFSKAIALFRTEGMSAVDKHLATKHKRHSMDDGEIEGDKWHLWGSQKQEWHTLQDRHLKVCIK